MCDNYIGQIDYFVFYNQTYDMIAIIPIEEIGDKQVIHLRIKKPKNKYRKNMRFFEDYTFDKKFT